MFRHSACPFAVVLLCCALSPAIAAAQDRLDEIDRLRAEADRLASQQLRRAHEALPLYRRAIALANANRDDARAARALVALGEALRSSNQSFAAVAALENAIVASRRARDSATEADALRVLGILAIEHGQHDRAEALLSRGLAVVRNAAPADDRLPTTEIGILNSLSVGARHQGRLHDARRHAETAQHLLNRALAEGRQLPERLLFQIPFNIGKSLADAGEYSSALPYFESAFRAAQTNGHKGGQWHALYDTAEWYFAQGDVERAARYHDRALALSRTMDSRDMEAHSLRGSGTVAEGQGRQSAAIEFYTGALSLMNRINLMWDIPETLVARARVRFAIGDRAGAEQDVRGALRRATAANEDIGRAHGHLELARQRLETGRFAEAETEYTRGLEIARARGVRPLVPIALTGLGNLAYRKGDLLTAARWYRSSVDTAFTIRGRIPSLDLRTAFAEATHSTFSSLIAVLLELEGRQPEGGYVRDALMTVELERSQNLLRSMNEQHADAPSGPTDRQRDRLEQLRSAVGELQTALLSTRTPGNRNYLLARLDDAERALAALEENREEGGRTADSGDVWKPSPDEIGGMQQSLRDDEALVEFARAGNQRVAFVILRGRIELVRLAEIDAIPERVEAFNRFLKDGMAREAIGAGRAITRVFIDPVLTRLPTGIRVLMLGVTGVPAGIPFAALPVLDPDGRPEPLIARYELAFVPSLAALAHLRGRPRPQAPRELLALADPGATPSPDSRRAALFRNLPIGALPYSGIEAQAIARYAIDPEVLIGKAASESAFKASHDDFRVLHFATHAFVDSETPARSALVLAASDADDGLLQPGEIHRARRRAEMVVLSACQSAGGRSSMTEGFLSLARAFIYAGARSVVGSHWDVNDRSTAKLIDKFYGSLAKGQHVAAALREAQLASAGPHPYATAAHWASFMVSGDPRADPQLQAARPPVVQLAVTLAFTLFALVALFGACLARLRRPPVRRAPQLSLHTS